MARINTKEGLRNYIKSQLGAPTIQVEVTDQQMNEIIDDTVQKFTEYSYGDLEDVVLLQINGKGEYQMPDSITNIVKFTRGSVGSNILNFNMQFGEGFVPNIWSEQFFSTSGSFMGDLVPTIISISSMKSQMEKFFGNDIAYNFNHLAKKIQVLEGYVGPAVLHYQYEYLADENNDYVYNHEWIKAYCIAKTRYLWGTVTGKYDQTLVGGGRINYADMKSEATEQIQLLNEELLTKWSDPAPISIA